MSDHLSLEERFNEALQYREKKIWNQAFLEFSKLEKTITSENIFSKNEELEDISTNNLKYLLVQYYLGEVLYADAGISNRLVRVQKTVVFFKSFLDRLEKMKIMKSEDYRMFYRGSSFDKRAQNGVKQDIKKKLEVATSRRQSEVKKSSPIRSSSDKIQSFAKEEKMEDDDSEAERNYWICEIHQKIVDALSDLDFAQQELPMLVMRKEMEEKQLQQDKNKTPTSAQDKKHGSGSSGSRGKEDKKAITSITGPTESGGGKVPFVYSIGGEKKGKKKKKKGETDDIPNIPLDVARELGLLKVSHQQAMGAAHAISAKKHVHPNIGGSVGGASIVSGVEVPTTACGPPSNPLSKGPVDGIHELKAKARDTVFRESNPPVIGLEEWAELMQQHNQLPTPERSAEAIQEAKKNRKKEKREAAKKGRVTKVKVYSGDMAAEALSDDDEGTDDEEEPTEEESDHATKQAREWDNWKDEHERGAGNRNFKK